MSDKEEFAKAPASIMDCCDSFCIVDDAIHGINSKGETLNFDTVIPIGKYGETIAAVFKESRVAVRREIELALSTEGSL